MGDYVKEYFDRHAEDWLDQAYVRERLPSRFPLGFERVRLAIQGVAGAVPRDGALCDLGCGGGQLCVHAARLGWKATGVDVAPGMVERARQLANGLPVDFIVAGFDENGLPTDSFDAVTALGLIEYLPDDAPLFAEASRLLRSGGRFAVSCRNRLYNLQSANEYTAREVERGETPKLLAELRRRLDGVGTAELHELAAAAAAAAADLKAAAELDREEPIPERFDHPAEFGEERRQHTPDELERSAAAAGFVPVDLYSLHPHPLPPALEPLAPRLYNRLVVAWQRPLEASPLGLVYCSAFVAVFERR